MTTQVHHQATASEPDAFDAIMDAFFSGPSRGMLAHNDSQMLAERIVRSMHRTPVRSSQVMPIIHLLHPEHIHKILTRPELDHGAKTCWNDSMATWHPSQIAEVFCRECTTDIDPLWSALVAQAATTHPVDAPRAIGRLTACGPNDFSSMSALLGLEPAQQRTAADAMWSSTTDTGRLIISEHDIVTPHYHICVAMALIHPPEPGDHDRILGLAASCAAQGYDTWMRALLDPMSIHTPEKLSTPHDVAYAMALCRIGRQHRFDDDATEHNPSMWFQSSRNDAAWQQTFAHAPWNQALAYTMAASLMAPSEHPTPPALTVTRPSITASQIGDVYAAMPAIHCALRKASLNGRAFSDCYVADKPTGGLLGGLGHVWALATTEPPAAIAMVDAITAHMESVGHGSSAMSHVLPRYYAVLSAMTNPKHFTCPVEVMRHITGTVARVSAIRPKIVVPVRLRAV